MLTLFRRCVVALALSFAGSIALAEPPSDSQAEPERLPRPARIKLRSPLPYVGSAEAEGGKLGSGQIALRGRLIAVASRGTPGINDPDDGVHILDGGEGLHQVRVIRSPIRQQPSQGDSDAIGVALDGDYVVFGTFGSFVTKVRLDGVVVWQFSNFTPSARPGLPALIDVDDDDVRDVIVPVVLSDNCMREARCESALSAALVLNGRDGSVIQALQLPEYDPIAHCAERVVGHEHGNARLWVGCVDRADLRPHWFTLAAARESPEPEISQPPLRVLTLPGLTDNPSWNRLSAGAEGLLVSGPGSKSIRLQQERAALQLQAAPSIGDIDLDGDWDIVTVDGGKLRVFDTELRGDAEATLWRGDAAASGAKPLIDSPAAYKSRAEPRDVARWLKMDEAPKDSAFSLLDRGPLALTDRKWSLEPLEATPDPTSELITNRTECSGTYGLNEGLLVRDRMGWQRVPGAPWPIVALRCAGSDLLLRTPTQEYALAMPDAWQLALLVGFCFVAFAAALFAWYTARTAWAGYAHVGPNAVEPNVRRVVISDAPRSKRSEAHPNQERLLAGLLNALDNDDTRPPVTVALYGPWGSGKTSLMRMLRSELKATGRYIDVWFNAWRYQSEAEIAPALLQSIVDEVSLQTDWVTRVRVLWHRIRRANARDLAVFFLAPALLVLLLVVCVRHASEVGVGGKLGAWASIVVLFVGGVTRLAGPLLKVFSFDPAKLLASDDGARRLKFVQKFTQELNEISTRLPLGARLVLFVDDLDRCAPARIVHVLETLSMLADTGYGFFVLAVDPTTVKRAIELQHQDILKAAREENRDEAAKLGQRYLEKVITLEVNVPLIAAEEVVTDARVDATSARPGFMEWFKKHVLPEPPLLYTLLLLAVSALWASSHTDGVNHVLDTIGELAIKTNFSDQETSSHAATSAAREPAPAATSALENTARPSTALEPPNAKPSTPQPRAPVLPSMAAPLLVQRVAREAPSEALALSRSLMFASVGMCVAIFLFLLSLVTLDWRRRKRIQAACPMSSDSPAFARALARAKRGLPATPRSVVRFTNTARFLYEVVAQEPGAPAAGWENEFLSALRARWTGEPEHHTSGWLKRALDNWLPDVSRR